MLHIVDGNALGNAFHKATKLTKGSMQTQAIYGFIRSMREIRAKDGGAAVVLWDGTAKHRFALLPTYKVSREKRLEDPKELADKQAYRAQLPVIHKIVQLAGIKQLTHPDFEADDLAGFLCKHMAGKRKRLVTGDSDWWQLIDADTDWYDPRKDGRLVTLETFHRESGYFTPLEYLQGKALVGDPTDDIPPVGGIGAKGAPLFLAEHRSVEAFFDKVRGGWQPKGKRLQEFAAAGRPFWDRNMKLMDLRDPAINVKDVLVTPPGYSREGLRTLCERLGFLSLTRQFDTWVRPFERTN
jgi:5'-3' exonuclease